MSRTVTELVLTLPVVSIPVLIPPSYVRTEIDDLRPRVALAVASMKNHMTDEGWQIMDGLHYNGYLLEGHKLGYNTTDVPTLLTKIDPAIVVVQDKREWDMAATDFRDPMARFENVDCLSKRPDIFKLTILKDAQQRPDYHRLSALEIGCHAWIVYYHPSIVKRLAPYVREQHLIRTYHSLDPTIVPNFSEERNGCLLSGAVSGAYPLRSMLLQHVRRLPDTTVLPHPGYHRNGCMTPQYLQILSKFKVAICTSSRYGYALRKIIEATACGCIVLTDLPVDEVLPHIDGNLVRIHPGTGINTVANILRNVLASYDPQRQREFAEAAKLWYDYRLVNKRLAEDIEMMRRNYTNG